MRSDTEENGDFPSVQENAEKLQSEQVHAEQQVHIEPVEENSSESEEMSILMKINEEAGIFHSKPVIFSSRRPKNNFAALEKT